MKSKDFHLLLKSIRKLYALGAYLKYKKNKTEEEAYQQNRILWFSTEVFYKAKNYFAYHQDISCSELELKIFKDLDDNNRLYSVKYYDYLITNLQLYSEEIKNLPYSVKRFIKSHAKHSNKIISKKTTA